MLAWALLASATTIASFNVIKTLLTDYPDWLVTITLAFFMPIIFCLGFLANYKLQDYTIARIGSITMFLVTIVFSIYVLILGPGIEYGFGKYRLINEVIFCIMLCVFLVALTCFTCVLQLALDQMPDASSSSITSFIAWIVFSISAGSWFGDFGQYMVLKGNCFGLIIDSISSIQIYSLCPVLFASLILVLNLLFAKSWLIIEPNPPKSFKIIYQVLKFAAKHKAPLNRSALTYWEEDIPSRMDLGKSRYGGPFTTEEVEDVKSILRMFAMSLPLWLISFALAFNPIVYDNVIPLNFPNLTSCTSNMLFSFTYSNYWWSMICTLVNEFFFYPLFRDRFPSILKRIGIASFLSLVLSIVFIIVQSLEVLHKKEVITIISLMMKGLLGNIFFCAMLELVCAQAPYNMRRLFAACMGLLFLTSAYAGEYISGVIHPKNNTMVLILFGIKAAMSLLGFILYCFLARWYKRRVRDEDYNAYRVVEEVYDRYLTPRNLDEKMT